MPLEENQLFTFEKWGGGGATMVFYAVTLKVPIGKHPAGTKFEAAVLDHSVLQLENPDSISQYELQLSVGKILAE